MCTKGCIYSPSWICCWNGYETGQLAVSERMKKTLNSCAGSWTDSRLSSCPYRLSSHRAQVPQGHRSRHVRFNIARLQLATWLACFSFSFLTKAINIQKKKAFHWTFKDFEMASTPSAKNRHTWPLMLPIVRFVISHHTRLFDFCFVFLQLALKGFERLRHEIMLSNWKHLRLRTRPIRRQIQLLWIKMETLEAAGFSFGGCWFNVLLVGMHWYHFWHDYSTQMRTNTDTTSTLFIFPPNVITCNIPLYVFKDSVSHVISKLSHKHRYSNLVSVATPASGFGLRYW